MFIFTICLTVAFLLSELMYRLRYPRVIGQILAGVILGLPFFGGFMKQPQVLDFIGSLADIGVIFLMLLVGTEIDITKLKQASKMAFVLAALGYIIPFLLGFYAMLFLEYELLTALIIGVCLAISAEAITLEILMEYKMLNTNLGTIIMEAGMIDDLLGVMSLAVIIGMVEGEGVGTVRILAGDLLLFIIISYLFGILVLPRAAKAVWKEKSEAAVFSLAIIFGLIIVLLSSMFSLSTVIGAFVAGIIIQLTIKNQKEEKEIVESLSIVTFGLVIPFFFIHTGLLFDIEKAADYLPLIILLTALALIGKLAAAQIMGAIYKLEQSKRMLMGWGMNSRGAVELIIASIALEKGLVTIEIFTAILSMAVLSAIISPAMFRRICLGDVSMPDLKMAIDHKSRAHHKRTLKVSAKHKYVKPNHDHKN